MSTKSREVIDPKLAKALAHPLRAQILSILYEKVTSPNQLAKELHEPLGNVSYHVKVLLDYDCAELVNTETRRGAIEHFYRATKRAHFSDADWVGLPAAARHSISGKIVELIGKDASEALAAGTMTERKDTHLSRTPMVVDEQGWSDITGLLEATLQRALEIQAEVDNRLAGSKDEGMHTRFELMYFKSPD